jgi:uncharacterized membrane protein YkgB
MPVVLRPRTYFLVDRGSKLIGLIAITASLRQLVGPLSPLLGLIGVAIGIATIFIEVDE